MNRTKQIINKTLSIIGVLFLTGCKTTIPDWGKYRGVSSHPHVVIDNNTISHDELSNNLEQIEQEAKYLDMSVVDYLHRVNSNKIKRVTAHDLLPDPFLTDLEAYPGETTLYQAYDPQYPGLPQIAPVFVTEQEAFKYASSNNFSGDRTSGHKYIVREVDYRYEVRHQNDAVNDVIFTSLTLEESEKYLNEYKTHHTDLVIFDLMDSVVVGVNTP
jgi:hypothetical protein